MWMTLAAALALPLIAVCSDSAAPRLAIISDPALRAEADLLLIELQKAGCIMIERNRIDMVLRELSLQAGLNRNDARNIGRLLKADGLVLLQKASGNSIAIKLVAADPAVIVWSGDTVIGRQWAKATASVLLPYIPKLMVESGDAVPISLLRLRPGFGTAEAISLADELYRLLLLRLVREQEIFVLERENLTILEMEAHWSGDSPSFWAGGLILEGFVAYDLLQPHKITLTLSAKYPPGTEQTEQPQIFSQQANVTVLAELVEKAAGYVLAVAGRPSIEKHWNLTEEAARLRRIVESIEDPEQHKNMWGSIIALGQRDIRSAAAFRSALRRAGYRDATRFDELKLTLAPSKDELELQARNFLELLLFHNTYRPPEGFTDEQHRQWILCHHCPLTDFERFLDAVLAQNRENELGGVLEMLQAEAVTTAKFIIKMDSGGLRGMAAARNARYRHRTTAAILEAWRAWLFFSDLSDAVMAQRCLVDPWFLDPRLARPLFSAPTTESEHDRTLLWKIFVSELERSECISHRIAVERRTITSGEPDAAAVARTKLQDILVDAFAGLDIRSIDSQKAAALLRDAFEIADASSINDVTEVQARNALALFKTLVKTGKISNAYAAILLKPFVPYMTYEQACEFFEALRRYIPARRFHTLNIPGMLLWIADEHHDLMSEDLMFALEWRAPETASTTTQPSDITQSVPFPVIPGSKAENRPWRAAGRHKAAGRYWFQNDTSVFSLDADTGEFEVIPFPQAQQGSRFSRLHITKTHMIIIRKTGPMDAIQTLFSIRGLAGGRWRKTTLPFEVSGLYPIGHKIYIKSRVRQITVYQSHGLVEMDIQTLKCRTLRTPGTRVRRPDKNDPEDITFDNINFSWPRVVDNMLTGTFGRRRYGWNPQTGEIKPIERKTAKQSGKPDIPASCSADAEPETDHLSSAAQTALENDVHNPAPVEILRIDLGNNITMDFCWIPPGSFMMGSPEDEAGRGADETRYHVTISRGFWLGRYEVTTEQCRQILGRVPGYSTTWEENSPKMLRWRDAVVLTERLQRNVLDNNGAGLPELHARLPTEAEWEYACRAGSTSALYNGHELSFTSTHCRYINAIAWHRLILDGKGARPVGMKEPNVWGLYDMSGNVREWCSDWYGPYLAEAAIDPQGPPSGGLRVARGGGWLDLPYACRSAARQPLKSDGIAGLRIVLAPATNEKNRQIHEDVP